MLNYKTQTNELFAQEVVHIISNTTIYGDEIGITTLIKKMREYGWENVPRPEKVIERIESLTANENAKNAFRVSKENNRTVVWLLQRRSEDRATQVPDSHLFS